MTPVALFGLQFTLALLAYALLGLWYVHPRLAALPLVVALQPLVWVHVFRFVGGSILAPGSVAAAVPDDFRRLVGYGDLLTSVLALLAVAALRLRWRPALALVWVVLVVGGLDTVNAIVWSARDDVFPHALGVNWVIVTLYVPALLVSTVLAVVELVRRRPAPAPARSS
jgi:hypothetical protein